MSPEFMYEMRYGRLPSEAELKRFIKYGQKTKPKPRKRRKGKRHA